MRQTSTKYQAQAHENQDADFQMQKKWQDLKNTERKIIAQQQIWDTDAIHATEELAEKTLTLGLEFVHMQEKIEAEHAEAVHSDFERAFQEENVLREFLAENPKTKEEDHQPDSFLQNRLEAAELVEMHAIAEEKNSLHHLAELYNQEDKLQEALKELNSLKKWEGMKSVDELYHPHDEQITQSLEKLKERKKDADKKLSTIDTLHIAETQIDNMELEDSSDVARVVEDLCQGIIQAALYFVNTQDEKVGERLVDKTIRILQDQKDDLKEEILTAALEYIRNVEHVEELHVHLAHRMFQEAMQEDKIFEKLLTTKSKDFMRPNTFRELECHLTEINEEEVQAIREEADALRHLNELCAEEEFIKALLEEIEKRNRMEKENEIYNALRSAAELSKQMLDAALEYVQTCDEKKANQIVDKTLDSLSNDKDILKEEILKKALDFVHDVEHVEEEHVHMAHDMFKEALQDERITEEFKRSMFPIKSVECENHLHEAQDEEIHSIREEANALHHLNELCAEEELIKALLDELRNRKKKKKKDDDELWEHMKWNLS
jgi:hypothetical protein